MNTFEIELFDGTRYVFADSPAWAFMLVPNNCTFEVYRDYDLIDVFPCGRIKSWVFSRDGEVFHRGEKAAPTPTGEEYAPDYPFTFVS